MHEAPRSPVYFVHLGYVCIEFRGGGHVLLIHHPSVFTAQWELKLGPPLQSAWAVQDTALANVYTSVLVNCLPFIRSWGALLLSCTAWMNMGLLCGHSGLVTLRAAHRALTRVIAQTPHDVLACRKCIAFIMPHLPTKSNGHPSCMYLAPALCPLGWL